MKLQSIRRMSAIAGSRVGKAAIMTKSDGDAVICSAVRTPITRARKGGFKDSCVEDLLSAVLVAVAERGRLPDKALVEDIAVGNVLAPIGAATVSRMASLHAGYPSSVALNTLNRQCSSSLATINQIANAIATGQIDIGIAAGVESMTQHFGPGAVPDKVSEKILAVQEAADCLLPMGITSENVASDFRISRKEQDEFASNSFKKAFAAQKAGKFKEEIVSVRTTWLDPKTGEKSEIIVSEDEGIREGVTIESLSKLKPAFSEAGSTHAGNASQVSDGAAAILLARRSVANKLGLPILAKFSSAVAVGVPPRIMGVGPIYAVNRLAERSGIKKEEIDFFEINEAFASQALYSIKELGIPLEKVNPVGGAIAFGHPLGATGARQVATALSEANRTGAELFVSSMCVGSGMGMAALFVNEET
ncbi:Thiolase, N-terminal domain-containing protein [Phakopsora pachyrhizi]|uniref:Thiolase, N-terminal domain-domain-containing protein n=1 Tax=Phakopsora pachyrhizi TaxID=170000 RepID=A0AAV0AWN0_PHAPC|nr:Thiolase, N-terminal domain-containing protein [Phakopsora pachyrhizi]CAH7673558.1 Thiolase, N-terminal domain-domain-containing protein [Phakopsora pachyrhizi]